MTEQYIRMGEVATMQLLDDIAARLRVLGEVASKRRLTPPERLELALLTDQWLEAEMARLSFIEANAFIEYLGRQS